MNFKKLMCLGLLLNLSSVYADTEISGLTLSGEAAFDYNLVSTGDKAIPGAGGAKDNEYRLNYAQLLIKKEVDKFSFFSRLFYLPTTYDTNGSEATANLGTLYQLELFYKVTPKLEVGFGRFLTTLGYESPLRTINHTYNYTISRQTLYPGYADGVRAKYHFRKNIIAYLSSYNRFANSSFGEDNSSSKATEASVRGAFGDLTLFAGYITSRDTNTVEKVDNKATSIWAAYKFLEKASAILTYEDRSADSENTSMKYTQSLSGTLTYDLSNHHLVFRYEYVTGANDINAINGAADFKDADQINSITLTDRIALNEHLNLYLEYRGDHANKKAFEKDSGSIVKNASMFTLGAIAYF